MTPELATATEAQADFAAEVFAQLRAATADVQGVTRESYGPGEEAAHALMAETARTLGLEVTHDAAMNTYMTWPGRDRTAPVRMVGSHLDSVPKGGNYDGAAGVVSGLTAIRALQSMGIEPPTDITVMGIRAEESCWFGVSYIGSRGALGTLPPDALETAARADSGRSLASHLAECGGDPERLQEGPPHLEAARIGAFLEPHIEQGPVLVEEGFPCGIVTGIRGNRRFPNARCLGEYAHCGGAPRRVRRDAVVAAAAFVQALDRLWDEAEAASEDFACTIGKFSTDADRHAMTIISGEVQFSVDVRSVEPRVLARLESQLPGMAAEIGHKHQVQLALGPMTRAAPGVMAPPLVAQYRAAAVAMNISTMDIASGASHDSAAFADAGVPTAMLFIRNEHGSHNPDEAMTIPDFIEATKLLTATLAG